MNKKLLINGLVLLLIALYLVPIWRFRFFPSSDGPCHIYNAQVLKHLRHPDDPFHDYFGPNFRPFPNWTASFLMWAFQHLVSPLLAEKLLLTVYVLLFVLSVQYLLKATAHRTKIFWLLSFLYLFNFLLLMGYYSFSLGVPLLLFTLGFLWKSRESLSWKRAAILGLLLVVLYFSHPVPFLIAIVALVLFAALFYRRRGRDIRKILVGCSPSVALGFYYVWAYRLASAQKIPIRIQNLSESFMALVNMHFLVTVDAQWQPILAKVAALLVFVLVMHTLVKKMTIRDKVLSYSFDQKDYFLLLSLVTFILSIVFPDVVAGHGSAIFLRTIFIGSLLTLPWLSDDLGKVMKRLAAGGATVLVVANVLLIYLSFSMLNKDLSDFISCRAHVGRFNTLIPLIFQRSAPSCNIPVFIHATNYYCLNNFNINLANYEADKDYFPVRFIEGLERPDVYDVFDRPNTLDFPALARYVKYIVAFGMNVEVMTECQKCFGVICQKGKTRLLRSRFWSSQETSAAEKDSGLNPPGRGPAARG